ncbi:hypothetical protein HSX11_02780 [Oxalobacteraceae bacterium]|nr:hypothetical protein [Oxalobacteraceae bacterium]
MQALLSLFLLANIALLAFFLAFDYQFIFHSDAAVKNLLAQEIADTGRYFPSDWNYVNNDLWVLNTHSVIVPLLHWLPNGYALHLLSDLLTAGLILYATWLMTELLGQRPLARLFSMLIISSGMSLLMAEHIFGQAAYGAMYYQACFLLYAYWRLCAAQGRARWPWAGATALLTLLVFWANPQRALVYNAAPLALAIAGQLLQAWQSLQLPGARRPGRPQLAALRPALLPALTLGGAALIGCALHLHTLAQVNNNIGLSQLSWVALPVMGRNLLATLAGLLTLFDGIPRAGAAVISPAGIYQALRLLGALLLLALLPWALLRAARRLRGSAQLVALFALGGLGLTLLFILSTTLTDAAVPEAAVRYLVPALMLALLVLLSVAADAAAPLRWSALAALALLASSAPTSYLWPYLEQAGLARHGLLLDTEAVRLGRFLRQQGLEYGYASFWQAGKLTVLNDSLLRVRPVNFEAGLPQPMRSLSSNRWYRASSWRGQSFLLLEQAELAGLDRAALQALSGAPVRELRFENWTVLVYANNLAAAMPAWDTSISEPVRYPVDQRSPHQIGRIEGTPARLVADPGSAGALLFGPQRKIERGSYLVGFDIETRGEGVADFGHLDISSDAGRVIHADQVIVKAGVQHVVLRLHAERPLALLEFRAFSSGRGQFIVRGVDIVRAPAS